MEGRLGRFINRLTQRKQEIQPNIAVGKAEDQLLRKVRREVHEGAEEIRPARPRYPFR